MKRVMNGQHEGHKGQALLIAILTLGGAILGATSLAGLLTLYQIRSTTDAADSAKAIFAADAGTSWALYDYFDSGGDPIPLPGTAAMDGQSTLSDGATVIVDCYDINGNQLPFCNDTDNIAAGDATTSYAIAEGVENGARRAFNVYLDTSTFP